VARGRVRGRPVGLDRERRTHVLQVFDGQTSYQGAFGGGRWEQYEVGGLLEKAQGCLGRPVARWLGQRLSFRINGHVYGVLGQQREKERTRER
jgi:hypothetical protein